MNLFMDDERPCPRGWSLARTVEDAKQWLMMGAVENLSLDHDMGEGQPTGMDLVTWMIDTGNWPDYMPTVHSANPVGAENMRKSIVMWFGTEPCDEITAEDDCV